MTHIKSVCVYCGSSPGTDELYQKEAIKLGEVLANQSISLVYGGGRIGLMGFVADSVLKNNGTVIGVIPEHLAIKEVAHHGLSELHTVDSMHSRKMMMVERSDAFVILPGGFGTMDEFFEVLTWKQLGLHQKPIIVVNVDGYWSALEALINNIINKKFAPDEDWNFINIIESVDELPEFLEKVSFIESEEPDTKRM